MSRSKKSTLDSVFLQAAIHDLKTPILAMKLFLEMALDPKGGSLTDAQRSNVEEVSRSNEQLLAMVRDLLTMITMEKEGDTQHREPVRLYEIINGLVEELQPSLLQKKIAVQWEGDPGACATVTTNPGGIKQAAHNLLTNAIRYNREGGAITLRLLCSHAADIVLPKPFHTLQKELRKEHTWCILSVRDGGIGIPEAEQSKVFERLFRASNAKATDPYGTGLGLYLTKTLVERVGGHIWFFSEEGKGTIFFIAIPVVL